MKLARLQTVLSVGLAVKVAALLLALVLTGPLFSSGPTPVAAQQAAPSAPAKPAAPADPLAAPKLSGAHEAAKTSYDPRLIKLLEARQAEIAAEEQRLARERAELEKLKADVAKRIAELKKVQTVLEKLVAAEAKERQARILQLVKVLSNMRPDAAAAVVGKLDDRMAVEIFTRMGSRQAGKLMAALNPEQAARISVLLTKQKEAADAAKVAATAAGQGAQPPAKPPAKKPARP